MGEQIHFRPSSIENVSSEQLFLTSPLNISTSLSLFSLRFGISLIFIKMFSPRGLSGKRFWGIQLQAQPPTNKQKQVRVNLDTELHISNVVVEFGNIRHEANCSFSVGVVYKTDRCDCDATTQSCSSHPQQRQSCVLCINKPAQKNEADLDINFVGGKNLTFYYSFYCDCNNDFTNYHTINISGYVVRS